MRELDDSVCMPGFAVAPDEGTRATTHGRKWHKIHDSEFDPRLMWKVYKASE